MSQKQTQLFFADDHISVKVFAERTMDSINYEILVKNISDEKIYIPVKLQSQIYSNKFNRIDITWTSGDTGCGDNTKIPVFSINSGEEYIYNTEKFQFTPNIYIAACYIMSSKLDEFSNKSSINLSKMLFSEIANEVVGAYGKW